MSRQPKAIALMSGGLDSTLAAKLVADQGVEVVALHLSSPFACRSDIQAAADSVGARLVVKEKGEAYLDLLQDPKFGRGRNLNPCIDCRIFMFDYAGKVMEEENADFVVTGEVVGQRPMSQVRRSLTFIDSKSPLGDRILRPLSGKRFPPSYPEKKGWIRREQLLDLTGRSRKPQLALAEQLGLSHVEAPGGGCLLTQDSFATRLRDYLEHDDTIKGEGRLVRTELLRVGRHFRVQPKVRAIVARRSEENAELESRWRRAEGILLRPQNFSGPTAVALGEANSQDLIRVAQLVARYGKVTTSAAQRVEVVREEGTESIPVSEKLSESAIQEMLL